MPGFLGGKGTRNRDGNRLRDRIRGRDRDRSRDGDRDRVTEIIVLICWIWS